MKSAEYNVSKKFVWAVYELVVEEKTNSIATMPRTLLNELRTKFCYISDTYATRKYHNLLHINYMLSIAENKFHLLTPELAFAIIFHDIVYKHHSNRNEIESATLARNVAKAFSFSDEVIDRIYLMILATAHPLSDPDFLPNGKLDALSDGMLHRYKDRSQIYIKIVDECKIIHDLDLFSFSEESPKVQEQNNKAVTDELLADYSMDEIKKGRAALFSEILSRPIYLHSRFNKTIPWYSKTAEYNIKKYCLGIESDPYAGKGITYEFNGELRKHLETFSEKT